MRLRMTEAHYGEFTIGLVMTREKNTACLKEREKEREREEGERK